MQVTMMVLLLMARRIAATLALEQTPTQRNLLTETGKAARTREDLKKEFERRLGMQVHIESACTSTCRCSIPWNKIRTVKKTKNVPPWRDRTLWFDILNPMQNGDSYKPHLGESMRYVKILDRHDTNRRMHHITDTTQVRQRSRRALFAKRP